MASKDTTTTNENEEPISGVSDKSSFSNCSNGHLPSVESDGKSKLNALLLEHVSELQRLIQADQSRYDSLRDKELAVLDSAPVSFQTDKLDTLDFEDLEKNLIKLRTVFRDRLNGYFNHVRILESENIKLQAETDKYRTTIKANILEIERLKKIAEKNNSRNLGDDDDGLRSLSESKYRFQEKIRFLENKNSEMEYTLNKEAKKRKKFKVELEDVTNERDDWEELNAKLEKEMKKLKKENKNLKNKESNSGSDDGEVENLKKQISKLKETNKKEKASAQEWEEKYQNLSVRSKVATEDLPRLQDKCSDLKNQLEETEKKLEDSKYELDDSSDKWANERKKLEEQIEEKQTECEKSKCEFDNKVKAITSLKTKVDGFQAEKTETDKIIKEMEEQCKRLREEKLEISVNFDTVESKLKDKTIAVDKMRNKLNESKKSDDSEVKKLNNIMNSTKEDLDNKEREVDKLNKDLKAKNDELENQIKNNNNLKKELDNLKKLGITN